MKPAALIKKGMSIKHLLFAVFAVLLTNIIEANDQPLELVLFNEISVASKKSEESSQAPGIITVISKEEIKGFAASNLGQVLDKVVGAAFLSPDVFIDQMVMFRKQALTPYNNHVLILLNGRPMRDPIAGGINASVYAAFPLNAIERIEIIRGPGSVLYGSCAYSGVINIITKHRKSEGFEGSIGVGGGSYYGFGQKANVSFRENDLAGHISVVNSKDEGPGYQLTDYNGIFSGDHFYRKLKSLMATFNYKDASLSIYGGDFDPYSFNGSETWDKSKYYNNHILYFIDSGYQLEVSEAVSINTNLTYNQHHWKGQKKQDTYAHDILIEINSKMNLLNNWSSIIGGGFDYHVWDGAIVKDGSMNSGFGYFQTDYKPVKTLKFIGGFQYNKNSNIEGNMSFRGGLIYNIKDALGIKLLYSEAFRKAYPLETSFDKIVFRGNLGLKPERIKTYEMQLFYNTDRMQSSLTYYNSKMMDRIIRNYYSDSSLTPPFYLQYENGGSWDFWGIEFEGKYQILSRLLVTCSAAYMKDKNDEEQEDATLHPNLMLKCGLLYRESTWSIGLFNSYIAEPGQTSDVNPGSNMVNGVPENYDLLSLKVNMILLEWGSRQDLEMTLEATNLLGKPIYYPDFPNKQVNSLYPLYDGTTYWGTLSWNF